MDISDPEARRLAIIKEHVQNTRFRLTPLEGFDRFLAGYDQGMQESDPLNAAIRRACYDRLATLGVAPVNPADYHSPDTLEGHCYADVRTVQDFIAQIVGPVETYAAFASTDDLQKRLEGSFRAALSGKRRCLGHPDGELRGHAPGDVAFPDGFFDFFVKHCRNNLPPPVPFQGDGVIIQPGEVMSAVTNDLMMVACRATLQELGVDSSILGAGAMSSR